MVVFMNRRIGALLEVLSPKDAACELARRLRQHVRAHDATTAALGIRAGRKKSPERGTSCTDPSAEVEEEGGGDKKAAASGGEGGELEEHHVEASRRTQRASMRPQNVTRVVFTAYLQSRVNPLFSWPKPNHDSTCPRQEGPTETYGRGKSESFALRAVCFFTPNFQYWAPRCAAYAVEMYRRRRVMVNRARAQKQSRRVPVSSSAALRPLTCCGSNAVLGFVRWAKTIRWYSFGDSGSAPEASGPRRCLIRTTLLSTDLMGPRISCECGATKNLALRMIR